MIITSFIPWFTLVLRYGFPTSVLIKGYFFSKHHGEFRFTSRELQGAMGAWAFCVQQSQDTGGGSTDSCPGMAVVARRHEQVQSKTSVDQIVVKIIPLSSNLTLLCIALATLWKLSIPKNSHAYNNAFLALAFWIKDGNRLVIASGNGSAAGIFFWLFSCAILLRDYWWQS